MTTIRKTLPFVTLLLASLVEVKGQGYFIQNGVTYDGMSFFGYGITVVRDPANGYTTGFWLDPVGRTPPTIWTNTFAFESIVDVGVRVFIVPYNQPISQQAIQAGNYTELRIGNSYVFNNLAPFYLGLYTGTGASAPPDGIYSDPLFGWVNLVNNRGVIEMLDSALVYRAEGIYAGTMTFVPEPGSLALLALAALALGCRRHMRNPRRPPNR